MALILELILFGRNPLAGFALLFLGIVGIFLEYSMLPNVPAGFGFYIVYVVAASYACYRGKDFWLDLYSVGEANSLRHALTTGVLIFVTIIALLFVPIQICPVNPSRCFIHLSRYNFNLEVQPEWLGFDWIWSVNSSKTIHHGTLIVEPICGIAWLAIMVTVSVLSCLFTKFLIVDSLDKAE